MLSTKNSGMFVSASVFFVTSIIWFLYDKPLLGIIYLISGLIELAIAFKKRKRNKTQSK